MVDPAVPPPPSTEVARKSEQRGAAYFLRALEIDTRMLGMVGALLGIWILFHFFSNERFLTPRNLWNLSCLLYTSPSPRDRQKSRMPSSA